VKNFFEIFDFPVSYRIDESALIDRYFEKSRSESDIVYLNEAYKTLMDPIDRAEYIIKLRGVRIDEICSESADEMFEIREKYDLLSSEDEKKEFQVFLRQRISEIIESLYKLNEFNKEFRDFVHLLRFIHSFLEKISIDVYSGN